MRKCLFGKTIRNPMELECSACRRKNKSSSLSIKLPNYSTGRYCLCGKKIRSDNQMWCSSCRKKRGLR